jgi:succinate dehydrogenase/fumarate reductase flavoprotein subunit
MPTYSIHRTCPVSEFATWDFETDVAVIGFGAAGACAAIEASTVGAEGMLFECNSGSGGASGLTGGEI